MKPVEYQKDSITGGILSPINSVMHFIAIENYLATILEGLLTVAVGHRTLSGQFRHLSDQFSPLSNQINTSSYASKKSV
jgi:hypothetical protein